MTGSRLTWICSMKINFHSVSLGYLVLYKAGKVVVVVY